MKIEIDVPDEVIVKIEHLMGLEIVDMIPLADYLVSCVIADTRCILENSNAPLTNEWPYATPHAQPLPNKSSPAVSE